jgi:DNA-binding XRE family transcriptional regulator
MTPLDDVDMPNPWDPPWRSRTAHRSCDPPAAAVLKFYRLQRGWSVSEAARQSGVSRRMIGMLEHAQRRPSESTAEALIAAYRITREHAGRVRSIAIAFVGRDSPYKTGVKPGIW